MKQTSKTVTTVVHYGPGDDGDDDDDEDRVSEIVHFLHSIQKRLITMSLEMDNLTAAVANNTTVSASAITLLQGIKAALDTAIANGADPAALTQLSTDLGTSTQALSDAVAANTPASPAGRR